MNSSLFTSENKEFSENNLDIFSEYETDYQAKIRLDI